MGGERLVELSASGSLVAIASMPGQFYAASYDLLEQLLAFALAAQESQQVTAAIAPDAIRHQHLHLFASRGSPHSQAHSIQKQIGIIVFQSCLMKLAHRLVQIPRQL